MIYHHLAHTCAFDIIQHFQDILKTRMIEFDVPFCQASSEQQACLEKVNQLPVRVEGEPSERQLLADMTRF
jgi:hypothetical protein